MRLWNPLILAAVLVLPGAARAQADAGTSFNPCIDTTGQDRQPDFSPDAGAYSAVLVTNDNPPKLRLNTNYSTLDPERIILPFEQELEALIVEEQSYVGSATLGWFYYQDLVNRGYVNVNDVNDPNDDTLVDSNNNGVPDFHEDLYNLGPDRAYIGADGPRCPTKTFTHTLPDGGSVTLREPDLLSGDCAEPTTYSATGGPRRWPQFADPEYPSPRPTGGVVGRALVWVDQVWPNTNRTLDIHGDRPDYVRTDSMFSDRGMFPHMPNLLEPRDPRNGNLGLGRIALLTADDDAQTCSDLNGPKCLEPRMAWSADGGTQVGPVWDRSGAADGIPDYKASAFDPNGRLRPGKNPTATPNEEDRRVKLGRVAGGQELVFFLVTYVDQIYGRLPGNQATDSCFVTTTRPDGRLQCQLWAHGDINVFFSKTLLNLDLHQGANNTVITKNLRNGWLTNGAYNRLNTTTYGNVFFPSDQMKTVYAYGHRAAHTIVGAPSNNPHVWILGWEDQNSGGNRTYNDTVILINKQNNGVFNSEIVSDISPTLARDYTITSVTLTIDDNPFFEPSTSGACSPNITLPDGTSYQPRPRITYQVALDCKVCTSACNTDNPVFSPNPEPSWLTVPFTNPTTTPGTRTNVTVSVNDFLEQGFTGTQLCWRAIMESPGEGCQPTINNVNVSYKAQKSGQYGRSGRIGVGNTLLYGAGEVPGRTWAEVTELNPSRRVLDGRPDMSPRGHVYLKKLYEPESPATTLPTSDAGNPPVWDGGEWLRANTRTGNLLDNRKLFTRHGGTRAQVKDLTGNTSPLFPTEGSNNLCTGTWVTRYDLDGSGTCDGSDRVLLREWLYGWEKMDNGAPEDATRSPRRTWPMGTINLSTPALVGPPADPGWLLLPNVSETEKTNFRTRFRDNAAIANRKNVAFIGTGQGFLHALDVGRLKLDDDTCTSGVREYNGYFDHNPSGSCVAARQYGTGAELFAYLPGWMLPGYVEGYVRTPRPDRPSATLDASPAVGVVDLGPNAFPYSNGTNQYSATRGYAPDSTTAWTFSTDPRVNTGAKTVLVSSAGPQQTVFFGLDVTNPASTNPHYPWPMWEYDMRKSMYHLVPPHMPCNENAGWDENWDCVTVPWIFETDDAIVQFATGNPVIKADTRGSRHNPLLTRMDFGARGGKKWVAAFATDFVPRPGTAGTLYLIDVKTGKPVMVDQFETFTLRERLAGVVTLGTNPAFDHGEGIGGDPAGVDHDGDGSTDVIYVPSTSGKVYKVNLRDVDASRPLGKVISSCVIANARTATYSPSGTTVENPESQRIYSDLVVRTQRSGNTATVQLYFGTANNPDSDTDADDLATTPRRYHIMAFQDSAPQSFNCAGGSQLWVRQLDLGQAVWGGLSLMEGAVTTGTAVGRRADVCSVDSSTSGRLYMLNQNNGQATGPSGTELGGHSMSTPVSYDRHIILPITTASGTMVLGANGGNNGWQNPSANGSTSRSRLLIWDTRPGGNIREVVP
ncbi:MAG TPA: pilus assembly protein PilY [Myxococcus sp.]|nr:pilus assembly protein PilY [Myxococcus sp.]